MIGTLPAAGPATAPPVPLPARAAAQGQRAPWDASAVGRQPRPAPGCQGPPPPARLMTPVCAATQAAACR